MKSFYSILYAGLNPASGDRLAVALFMHGVDAPLFAYSKHRLGVVRDLMGKDARDLLLQNLKGIQRQCLKDEPGSGLFEELSAGADSVLSEPYFGYLSRYSNNLLTVGPVTPIEVEATEEHFQRLFRLFVDDHSIPLKQGRDIQEVRTRLRERTADRLKWDARITNRDLPNLPLTSVQLDFVGRNGKDVIGEVMDFEKKEYNLEMDILKLDLVARYLKDSERLGKAYAIGDEPDAEALPEQHKTWEALKHSRVIELVPTDEVERVTQHLQEQDVRPW